MLTLLFPSLLLLATFLPIPSRAQSPTQVQFPTNLPSCIACQPAFSSRACQTILTSISRSSSSSLSNSTLASCQCSSAFLSLYPTCVECFTETNQISLVFGSTNAPTQSSLEAYCRSLPPGVSIHGDSGGMLNIMTVTKTVSATMMDSPTVSPTFPSSAMTLKSDWTELGLYGVLTISCALIFTVLF